MEILRLVLCTMLTYLSKEEISSGLRRAWQPLASIFKEWRGEKKKKAADHLVL